METLVNKEKKGRQMNGNYLNNSVFTGIIVTNNQKYINLLMGVESLEAKWYGSCLKSSVFHRTSGFDSQPGRRQFLIKQNFG